MRLVLFVFVSLWAIARSQTYSSVLLGSPPCGWSAAIQLGATTFQLLVDTGSSSTVVASSQCSTTCSGISPVYKTTSTSNPLVGTYIDGATIAAYGVFDTMKIGTTTAISSFEFAALVAEIHLFTCANAYQGVLGLAFPALTFSNTQTTFTSLGIPGYTVQLCPTGGNIWFGGADTSYFASIPVSVPLYPPSITLSTPPPLAQQGYLLVQVDSINVQGKPAALLQVGAYSTWQLDSSAPGILFAAQSDFLVFGAALAATSILSCPTCTPAQITAFWQGTGVLMASKVTVNTAISIQALIWNGGYGFARADYPLKLDVNSLLVVLPVSPSNPFFAAIYFNCFYIGSGTVNTLGTAAFVNNIVLVNSVNNSMAFATGKKCGTPAVTANINYIFSSTNPPSSASRLVAMTSSFLLIVVAMVFCTYV